MNSLRRSTGITVQTTQTVQRMSSRAALLRGMGIMAETRQFDTGATRDADTGKLDYEGFISPLVDRRYAEYMHRCRLRNVPAGQTIRASDNWQKGIPVETYA